MPSATPLAWHRRALRSEGRNTNVQPIVQSLTFRVSPLPPLSLLNGDEKQQSSSRENDWVRIDGTSRCNF